ncbi:MAG: fimbrillin family protein [Bacteroides sp.]|nr:fimbrillin family protein [Bacteroides sp.]
MKNLNYISALLCAVALTTSCSNEEIVENGTAVDGFTLVATTGADTRTSVDDKYNVNWTAADAFYVFGGAAGANNNYPNKGTFTLINGSETTGTFKGTVTGAMSKLQYAVYPDGAYNRKDMKITFPTTYTYPNSNAPMFGHVNGTQKKVVFDQLLCGMIRIKINNLGKNSGSLTLKGTGIAGSAKLTIGADDKATLSDWADKKDAIELKFNNSDEADPLVLDIPVLAGTYTAGLSAELAIDGTSTPAVVFETTSDFIVTEKVIKEMPDITIANIDATTISFTKEVEDVAGAKEALEAGSKNVTIATVSASDKIEIPSTSKADAPVTINISSVSGNDFTIEGANDATDTSVKINMPEGSTGTVTVKNIAHVEISGGWTATTYQIGNGGPLVITAGEGVKELTVKEIDHVEISGNWEKVNSSTGENTLVVKADAVVDELIVNDGNIKIEEGGEVKKLTLNNNVTINQSFDVLAGKSMEIDLGTHTLTLPSRPQGIKNYVRIYEGASLTIKGAAGDKGKVVDETLGLSLLNDNAKFTMENVDYEATLAHANGIIIDISVSGAAVNIKNSIVTSKDYCLFTNATTPVGSGNSFTLANSEFTALETAFLANTPVTITATNCAFTGGWQGAFMRGGTSTFDGCTFNLAVDSEYGSSTVTTGKWDSGNQAPSAALTIGNKNGGYDYEKNVELKNNCAFTVKVNGEASEDYPAIYIDTDSESQKVTFKYDSNTFGEVGKGLVIKNTTGLVTVNGTAHTGNDGE